MINVKTLGAKGDGLKDDYSIIQSAINKANSTNDTVYIPSGTYLISSTLLLKDNVQIVGDGPFLTKIKMSPNITTGIMCKLDSDVTKGIVISNLEVYGDKSKNIKQTALYLENYHYLCDVKNIRISNVNKGIYITNSWYAQIRDISLMGVDEYGIEVYQKSSYQQVNALPLTNIQQDGGNTAIYAHAADDVNGRGLYITNSVFEHTKKTAIILEYIGNTSIKDCYFEDNYTQISDNLTWNTPTDIKVTNNKWASQFSAENITIAAQGKYPSNQTCNIYVGDETVAKLSNIDISYYGDGIRNYECAVYSDTTYPIFTNSIHMTDGLELIKKKAFTLAGNDLSNTMDISMSCGNLLRNSDFRFGTGFWSVYGPWQWNVDKSSMQTLGMSINQSNLTEDKWYAISQKIINSGASETMQCGIEIMTPDKDSFKGGNIVLDVSGYKEDGSKEYIYSTNITPSTNNEWISEHIVFSVPEYIKFIKYSIVMGRNGNIKIKRPYVNLGYIRPLYSCDINGSKLMPTISSNAILGDICWSDDLGSNKPIGWIYCDNNVWKPFGVIL